MTTSNNTNTTNLKAMPRPASIVDKYSYNELHRAAHEMHKTGGSFAAAIADAFFVADSHNKAILLNAFGHLFERFIEEEVSNK